MLKRIALFAAVAGVFLAVIFASNGDAETPEKKLAVPEMVFNDVKEIAPGVFFRYSSISATDTKIPFGGSNNIWIVFKDYVVVVDANFPKEAEDVIADIKKTTDKPIKYVLDTHHHGDHAYGNQVWVENGATPVAHVGVVEEMKKYETGYCGDVFAALGGVLPAARLVAVVAGFVTDTGGFVVAAAARVGRTAFLGFRAEIDQARGHHGDHAYGNCAWAKVGAKIVAHTTAARLLKVNGPKQWTDAGKDRKDIRDNELKQADITFDDKYVLDDGTQRVEFLHFGHSHTAGDASAYLPKLKILCTGDACVNGAFNFMGHSNSAAWVKCLEKMEKLDVDLIAPGHGKVTGKELLAKQKRYFVEMRGEVQKGIDGKKPLDDITASLEMPWYKEWTGKPAKDIKDNVKHVYEELTGKIDHERLGMIAPPLGYSPNPRAVAELPTVIRGAIASE